MSLQYSLFLRRSVVLHQLAGFQFVLEAFLCPEDDILQDLWFSIPLDDSAVVGASAFFVDDEGCNIVPEAFLHHNDPAYSAVVIIKRMDAFKMNMKVQNLTKINRHFLVISDQIPKLFADLLRRNAHLIKLCTELTHAGLVDMVCIGAVGQQAVHLLHK